MSDVLSAEEIAKLVAAAQEGNLPDAPRKQRRSQSVHKIDFSRPMKMSPVEQRRFERAHANFCRDASVFFSSELRASLELEVINSAQLTWSAALDELPKPSAHCVAACSPGEALILLSVEEGLLLRMLERLLGGDYGVTPPPRELTPVDTALSCRLLEGLLGALSATWQELLGIGVGFAQLGMHNTSLEYLPPYEPTLSMTIEVRDKGTAATMSLLVPYAAIEPGMKRPDGGVPLLPSGEKGDASRELSFDGALGGVGVEVRAEIGSVGLTIGDVLALGEGDVIRLGPAGKAAIVVGETPLQPVRPGLAGSRRAVQILQPGGAAS